MANTSVYVKEKNNSETIVKGSMYYSEDFRPGWILLTNTEDTTQNLFLRYNIYHSILEWKLPENEVKNLLIDRVKYFALGDDLFVNAQQLGTYQKGFLKSVYSGESISIYFKTSIKRKDIKAKPPFEEENSILFYETVETYIHHNNEMHSINSKKELERLLNNWKMKSVKFKKSDLQDDVFLQSLGEMINNHLK
jgi:hypothetical protein